MDFDFDSFLDDAQPQKKRGRPSLSGSATPAKGGQDSSACKFLGSNTQPQPTEKLNGGRSKKEAEPAEDEYEVEAIVDSVIDADTMEHMFLVKWKNYPASDNTWEPKRNLKGLLDLVREFEAKKKRAEAAEAAAKKAVVAEAAEKKTTRTRKLKAVKEVKAAKKAPGRPGRTRRTRA